MYINSSHSIFIHVNFYAISSIMLDMRKNCMRRDVDYIVTQPHEIFRALGLMLLIQMLLYRQMVFMDMVDISKIYNNINK